MQRCRHDSGVSIWTRACCFGFDEKCAYARGACCDGFVRSGAPLAILVEGTGVRSNGSAIPKFSDAVLSKMKPRISASIFSDSSTMRLNSRPRIRSGALSPTRYAHAFRSQMVCLRGTSHSPRIGFLSSANAGRQGARPCSFF